MTFHVGMKVVCVDGSGSFGCLIPDQIYTISDLDVAPISGKPTVWLGELGPRPEPYSGWYASRFRPLVKRQTDISIFTKMLTGKRTVKA